MCGHSPLASNRLTLGGRASSTPPAAAVQRVDVGRVGSGELDDEARCCPDRQAGQLGRIDRGDPSRLQRTEMVSHRWPDRLVGRDAGGRSHDA